VLAALIFERVNAISSPSKISLVVEIGSIFVTVFELISMNLNVLDIFSFAMQAIQCSTYILAKSDVVSRRRFLPGMINVAKSTLAP